jgi:hypothetical protein
MQPEGDATIAEYGVPGGPGVSGSGLGEPEAMQRLPSRQQVWRG